MKLIIPDNIPRRKRRILGPLGRLLMKVCNWKIVGEFPTDKRMVLIAVPHTAMRDAWYALLAVLALDLKINFFGAKWIFTRLPSLFTISKSLDRLGIPWPLGWLQSIFLKRLGGIPVTMEVNKGLISSVIDTFSDIDNFILAIAIEGGGFSTEDNPNKFRSGFYYIAKGLDIPYLPITIDFGNREFRIMKPAFARGTFEEESQRIRELFDGVEGATRTFAK